ncbi:hypothetical protein [Burkholderia gladioli]|uniref:hypothetical protein n=1 Tax=Burkholderia gladioli TaxID=28095 RepID=UPI001641756D|nr:hypothetical protein [Burkholderia gladioli]
MDFIVSLQIRAQTGRKTSRHRHNEPKWAPTAAYHPKSAISRKKPKFPPEFWRSNLNHTELLLPDDFRNQIFLIYTGGLPDLGGGR